MDEVMVVAGVVWSSLLSLEGPGSRQLGKGIMGKRAKRGDNSESLKGL